MIQLSATVQALLVSPSLNFFYLVKLGANKFYTSAPYNVTMDDGITYVADSGLIGVEPPRISSVVDRASYKISFADSGMLLKSYFETGAVGDPVVVRIGFFNTLGHTVGGVAPDLFFPQLANTMIVYSGVVDGQNYNIDFGQGEVTAVIECASPMADLDMVRSFKTNSDSMITRDPNDICFNRVFQGSGSISYNWGKT
jgi:hypothetical protein